MNDDDVAFVRTIATEFRVAIDKCLPQLSCITFAHFPRGACGDICDLLGKYLIEQGLPDWTYVSGHRGDDTHAWLENDGLIVDITADQFDDNDDRVIVTKNHSWHQQFSVKSRNPPGTFAPLPEYEMELAKTYQAIVNAMNSGK